MDDSPLDKDKTINVKGKSWGRKIRDTFAGIIGTMVIVGAIAHTCSPPPRRDRQHPESVPSSFTRHQDAVNHYSIQYPSSWETMSDDLLELARARIPGDTKILFAVWSSDRRLNMQVSLMRMEERLSLDELSEQVLSGSPTQHQNISQKQIIIQNNEALQTVNVITTPGGKPGKYVHLFLLRGDYAWFVGAGGQPEAFDENRSEIDKMIHSLEFESS